MMTITGKEIPDRMLGNYLERLVGRFFKILPIRESEDQGLTEYLGSLRNELVGLSELMEEIGYDEMYLSLIVSVQYLMEHECCVQEVKREVFRCISVCKKLRNKYFGVEV